MTKVVSSSFCRYAHTAEPLAALDEFKARCDLDGEGLWSNPVLQIVDIQKFVGDPDPQQPPRFYVVLSDAEECIWAVVPVHSKLEAAISCGDAEVGCLLTLLDYAIVAAKCAKNIIIILDATFSSTSVSVIGAPRINAALIQLSSQSLLHRNAHMQMLQKSSALSLFTERQVKDFLPEDGGVVFMDPHERWSIVGRILWRSKLRRVADAQNSFGTATQQQFTSTQQRTAFDCVIVDHNGDGIKAVFWGLRSAYDVCEPGHCVRLAHGTVKRDPRTSMPIALQFQDKSSVDDLGDGDDSLPCRAINLVGACAVPFEEVARVLEHNAVGDIISVHGVVHHVFPCTSVRTRNGMVDKVTLTLKDRISPQTIDMTLWDEAARNCEPLIGETWCFRDVVVRMFGNAKQLSSRASSEIFQEPAALANATGVRLHPTSYYPHKPSKELSHAVAPVLPPSVPSLSFVFSLQEVRSESQFVLVKIQRIKFPLFYLSCKTCGAQMRGMMCLNCSSSQSELRFLVRMELSDGIHGIQDAVGFTVVGETLFGESTVDFAAKAERDGNYVKMCVEDVICLPVLVKIIRSPEGVCHVSELKHVALAPACRALCHAIDEYLIEEQ